MITQTIYNKLAGDGELTYQLATYEDDPAIFTTDPAPGNAELPYIVTAGEVSSRPFDTKQTRGRELMRDVRCYTAASGSAEVVETIAERVRALFHRQALTIEGFGWLWGNCTGPIVADEENAYGRIVTLTLVVEET